MLIKKKKIGIIYSYNENWIGGTYYVQNLLSSIVTAGHEYTHCFYLVTEENKLEFKKLIKLTKFKTLKYTNLNRPSVFPFFVKMLFPKWYKSKLSFDVIFPLLTLPNKKIYATKIIFWIPDFQERYYPNFFTEDQLVGRDKKYLEYLKTTGTIVFSSNSVRDDFNKFYPRAKNKTKVINFSVVLPKISHLNPDLLLSKFKVNSPYFMVSNQFWQHKNHDTIINALNNIKVKIGRCDFMVLFTGKEYDDRSPGYTEKLKEKVRELGLENEVRFLGFLNREEQLCIMKNSMAVIQPSLFEGWSTVIEDAKSLNVKIIASDIPVHREQLLNGGRLFQPLDFVSLSNHLIDIFSNFRQNLSETGCTDYNLNIIKFGNDFMDLIE